jgi:hypothetical protein
MADVTIYSRNDLGRALTYAELDGNFVNLKSAIESVGTGSSGTSGVSGTSGLAGTSGTSGPVYRIINTADSATITGTTANTLIYSQLIPANTFAAGDVIRLSYRALKTGVVSTSSVYFYINTTNTVTLATALGQYFGAATTRMIQVDRKLYIKNTRENTEMFNTGLSNTTYPEYIVSANNVFTNIAIDWTVNQYIIFANALGSASDSFKGSSYEIERIRTT